MDKKMGLFSLFAFSNASSPQGYQSTGLEACCSKYGLWEFASRFWCFISLAIVLLPQFQIKEHIRILSRSNFFIVHRLRVGKLEKIQLIFLFKRFIKENKFFQCSKDCRKCADLQDTKDDGTQFSYNNRNLCKDGTEATKL